MVLLVVKGRSLGGGNSIAQIVQLGGMFCLALVLLAVLDLRELALVAVLLVVLRVLVIRSILGLF